MLTKAAFAFILLIALNQQGLASEVYRWVDENGKVHYSDSANKSLIQQKKKQTIKAEAVELPPVNNADPSDSFSEFYSHSKEAEQNEKLENIQAQHNALAEKEHRDNNCAHWLATYNSYGNRHNTITYMVDDNGKSPTEKQQQKELEKMRRQLVALGCL